MVKKFMAAIAMFATMLYAAASFAAVDVNKATAAELDSVKGIGPAISAKILDERKKGNFKDWNDFVSRVSGIGEKSAANLSTNGLTVGGAAYKGAPAKAEDKPAAAKKDDKPAKAEAKVDPKAEAKAKAAADKKAAAEAKVKEKADKKAAADAKADKKADKKADAKPAADAKK
jgi:competence protein ComEA